MIKWFFEELYPNFYKQSIKKDKELVNISTEFQKLEIFENSFFGKVLVLDGVVQTTERDEYFYHEMFVHVPLVSYSVVAKKNPERVLIIGGGDGGILREVLKYSSIKQAIMIELDEAVTRECEKHMPALNNLAFKDKRADVRFIDGIDYIKRAAEDGEKFDAILVDSTDPIGAAEPLFTKEFYSNCNACLNKNGILATQSGVPFFQKNEMEKVNNTLSSIFNVATFFVVPVPTYVGSFMVLSFASSFNPLELSIQDYKKQWELFNIDNLKYYNPEIHFGSFLLPNYIKNSII